MENKGFLRRGAALAWGRKRYFAWLYAASFLFAGVGALAMAHQAGALLNHSLDADRLLHGFDVAALFAVISNPAVDLGAVAQVSALLLALYFLAVLLLTPGIVFSFVHVEPPSTENLFRASGRYFWSFVRLLLWTLLFAGIIVGGLNAVRAALLKFTDNRTGDERVLLAVSLSTLAVVLVVEVFLRLWFDLAEFLLVRRADRASRRTLLPAWRALRRAPLRLFAIHVVTALAGWIVFALGAWLWWHAPSASVWLAFLLGQGMTLALLAARYWQRASEAAWFIANVPLDVAEPAPLPAPVALAAPQADAAIPGASS